MITRAQLLANGVSASTIDYRCRQGKYHRLLPTIYCTEEPTALARCAAVIEWMPDAVLSHRTSAWLRGWITEEPTVFEATVPKSQYRDTPKWLKLYRRNLPRSSVDECWNLTTTDAAQTLFDCVAVLAKDEAEKLVDEHLGRGVSPEELVLHDWLVLRYAGFDVFKHLDSCADEAAVVIRRRRHSLWGPNQ